MVFCLPLAKQSGHCADACSWSSLVLCWVLSHQTEQAVAAFTHSFSTQRLRQEDLGEFEPSTSFVCLFLTLCVWVLCLYACLGTTCLPRADRGLRRRLHSLELELQAVVSHHVGASHRTPVLWKSAYELLNHLSSSSLANFNMLSLSLEFWRHLMCLGVYLSVSHWRLLGV